jgi:ABC-type multidrug transport system ATPase subunit
MIHIAEISHTYRSLWRRAAPVRALDALSLEIAAGSAVGLIGVNGAGKTTLLRLLLGYLRPSAGVVTIANLPPRAYVERHGIGYVPERVAIPRRWTVEGALQAYALLGNVSEDGPGRVEAALRRLGLEEIRERRVGALSKGNLQRVAIAQAMLCDRTVLVLDEPTDGLDPVWIAEMREILADWRAADPRRVLIVASHDLPMIERIASRAVVLHDGRAIADLDLASGPSRPPLEESFLRLVREQARAA